MSLRINSDQGIPQGQFPINSALEQLVATPMSTNQSPALGELEEKKAEWYKGEETRIREAWQTRAKSYDRVACVRSAKINEKINDLKTNQAFFQGIFPTVQSVGSTMLTLTHAITIADYNPRIDELKDRHTQLVIDKKNFTLYLRTLALQELKLLLKFALSSSETCPYTDEELKKPYPDKFDFFRQEQKNWSRVLSKAKWIRTTIEKVIQEYTSDPTKEPSETPRPYNPMR